MKDSVIKKSNDLERCKEFMCMNYLRNVQDWNNRREEAKNYFTEQCISQLDASGFINQIL
jgi:hypothetical protein